MSDYPSPQSEVTDNDLKKAVDGGEALFARADWYANTGWRTPFPGDTHVLSPADGAAAIRLTAPTSVLRDEPAAVSHYPGHQSPATSFKMPLLGDAT